MEIQRPFLKRGGTKYVPEVLRLMKEADLTKKQAVATVAALHPCSPTTLARAVEKHLSRNREHIVYIGSDETIPEGYFALEGLFKKELITNHLRGQGVFTGEFGVYCKRRGPNDSKGKYYIHAEGAASYVAKKFPHLAPTVIGASTLQPPQQQKLPDIPKEIEQEAKRSVEDARNHVIALLTRIAVSNDQILDVLEELLGCWVGNAKPK